MMNVLEAFQKAKDEGVSVKIKSWKNGQIGYYRGWFLEKFHEAPGVKEPNVWIPLRMAGASEFFSNDWEVVGPVDQKEFEWKG